MPLLDPPNHATVFGRNLDDSWIASHGLKRIRVALQLHWVAKRLSLMKPVKIVGLHSEIEGGNRFHLGTLFVKWAD